MKFSKHLYFCDECKKKKRKIKHKLRWHRPMQDIFLIVLSEHEDHQLEIYNSNHLIQPVFHDDVYVFGITKGYGNAVEYVEELVNKVYNETGGADIRSYLLNREQEDK